MRRGYRAQLGVFLILVACLFATTGVAHAATREITISPTSESPVITPGKSYDNSFGVINNGQTGYDYQVYATPYHVIGKNYTPNFTSQPNTIDASKWFSFSTVTHHSNPGQTIPIDYSITVPATTPPGGYYATIFAQTLSDGQAESGVALTERVGEIFYIQVSGPVVERGAVAGWDVAYLQQAPVVAVVSLQNSGGLHFIGTTDIKVKDILGHTKFNYSTTREVLPQTTRPITATWSNPPPIGLFKVSATVSYLNQHKVLPTKWVLVMAVPVRLVLIGLFVVLVVVFTRRPKRKGSRRSKKPKQ